MASSSHNADPECTDGLEATDDGFGETTNMHDLKIP